MLKKELREIELNQEVILKNIKSVEYKADNGFIFFAMLSMTVMLSKGIFSYRLIELFGHVMQAGQLIVPFWFILSDIIAEVYGYKNARKIIYAGFVCQIIFSIVCRGLLQLPSPSFWKDSQAYQVVLGDMWRISLAVLCAFIISGFINIKLISKWKLLTNGRYFWLRSIGASGISEILFSILSTFIIQIGRQPIDIIVAIITASIVVKLIYSISFSIPANILVFYLKK